LPGAIANPKAGLTIAGALVTAGLAPEIVAGGAAGVSYAQELRAGVNISAGYLNTTSVSPGQTTNFAAEYAGGGSALYGGLGGGIMVLPGNGTATVIGFGAGTNGARPIILHQWVGFL